MDPVRGRAGGGVAGRAHRLRQSRRRDVPPVPRAPRRRRSVGTDRFAARQPRRSRVSRDASSPWPPTSSTAPTFSTASTSSAGTRVVPAAANRSSTASTTTTSTTPSATSLPTTRPSARSWSTASEDFTEQCVDEQRGLHPVRRHEQLGTRHRHDPSGARRGRDQLLRVQLRLRARWGVDHAVPRHRPCRRVRRCGRPQRRHDGAAAATGRRLRGDAGDVPRPVQCRPRLCLPQRR